MADADGRAFDVWIMDDQSNDGSKEIVERVDWSLPVTFVERTANRGLAPAVVQGIAESSGEIIVVMDADHSHPVELIPELVDSLRLHDMTFGSRYVNGGTTEEGWGVWRWVNSKVATVLALPLVKVSDPMSGFFTFPREALTNASKLNPIGYKIGLEIAVKCNRRNIGEIPIHFSIREEGKSKLTFTQQLLYLEHLRRLYSFRCFRFLGMGDSLSQDDRREG